MKAKLAVKRTRKKSAFNRQNASAKKLGWNKWRYPRGKSSKIRLRISGHRRPPSIGFGSSKKEHGLNRYGFEEVYVSNESHLHNLNKNKHSLVLSGKLGMKKRLMLLEKIKEHGFHIMNFHDINEEIQAIKNAVKERKEVKQSLLKAKTETKKKQEKAVEKKQVQEEQPEVTQEDKEKQEREEKRKILEQKM